MPADYQPALVQSTQPIDSVEDYQFEPIKGYPMLNWHGKRPFRSTRFYPAQLKEIHGPDTDGWRNKIFWGDNLQVMSHLLKEYRGQIDLVYIDPPFDSNADYKRRIALRNVRIMGDQGTFEDKQYTDIWINDGYLQFMYDRLILLKELLKDTGTLWLHCDYHKSHHLRCLLEEIFGESNLVVEIIWKRAAARGNVKHGLSTAHDTILCYGRSANVFWRPPRTNYSEEYLARFSLQDSDGRKYALDNMVSPNPDRPNLDYEWNGVRRVWRVTKEKMAQLECQGRIAYTSTGVARYKRYLDELGGQPLTTVWDNIDPVNSQARERENYPTQKPQKLLERVIATATPPSGLVFDCFMGSGTTQAVAMKLGRRFIGADINLGAVQVTTKRLIQVAQEISEQQRKAQNDPSQNLQLNFENTDGEDMGEEEGVAPPPDPTTFYTGFEVYTVNHYDIFRNPIQAKELLLDALEIQPLSAGNIFDGTQDGRMVKIMPVNHIATRADLNDLIANLDYNTFDKRYSEKPNQPVERITLVCMGHEPDLAAHLKQEVHPYKLDVEVVDILRDRQDLQFKRDSEAQVVVKDGQLTIEAFYPMNLLQKLSYVKEDVSEWRELVESIMIDWNYDGAVLTPAIVDVPEKDRLVKGCYKVPDDAGAIRVKITDLLSESWEGTVRYG